MWLLDCSDMVEPSTSSCEVAAAKMGYSDKQLLEDVEQMGDSDTVLDSCACDPVPKKEPVAVEQG